MVEAATAKAVSGPGTEDLRDPAYLKIRDVIYQVSGIYQPEEKLYLLASRCSRRTNALKIKTPGQYLEFLTARENKDSEMRALLNEITIGETYMFRSPPQLEALRNVILPQIVQSKASLGFKRLRIWSAGCSTGEEPYTLAIFLLQESEKLLAGWTFEILATDLNENSLVTAKEGIYGDYALRNTTDLQKMKYFKSHDAKRLQANEKIKSLIRFDRVNLADASKMTFLKGMDLIFCCNVLIYFDLASKGKVVQHYYANLMPGGYLFLGHAESLYQIDTKFQLVHFPGAIGYWKAPIGSGGGKP
jgi:chemotaxis protein methyltransferase CheR